MHKTFRFREGKSGEVLDNIGSFANLIDLGEFALAMCTDGVGSKVIVAQELEKYDSVGIDLIAMNVNDLICTGAEPISMVDYLAVSRVNPNIIKEIAHGIFKGAKQADIAIIGGETATLPEIITGVEENGFDLAGTAIGIVKKDKIITGKDITPGDVILGFRSSGVHSNGLTLARKVLPRSMWIDLLTPTRIYVKEIMELTKEYTVKGLAHITGGGFTNLLRVGEYGFLIDQLPKIPLIFEEIQQRGDIPEMEMYKTFNMGIGFCAIVSEADSEEIIKNYAQTWNVSRIGRVIEEPEVRILREDHELRYS